MINNQYTHDADPVSEDKYNIIIRCKYVNNTTIMCLMTYISIILRAWNTMELLYEDIDTFPHKNVSEKKLCHIISVSDTKQIKYISYIM